MTAVFVSRRFFNIGHVYGKELQEKLGTELDFIAPIKSMEELEARKK